MTSYVVPSRVAYAVEWQEGEYPRVFLRPVPGGMNYALVGSGALIWCLAVDGVDDVVAEVARVVDVPAGAVREDVLSYLDHVVEQGLLVKAP